MKQMKMMKNIKILEELKVICLIMRIKLLFFQLLFLLNKSTSNFYLNLFINFFYYNIYQEDEQIENEKKEKEKRLK